MSSIDKRIVEMQFNNQGFEKGVNTTLNSLKKLQEGLKLKGASKGVDEISGGMNKLSSVGFGAINNGLSSITSQFSALGVMGVTALANITNSAVNAGKRLAKALTIDPIMTGFSEYELKMNSISTILANTADEGATIDDVNKALNELNEYSDQTIYNFAQMTDNIGKFTAAGVNLEDSVAAIKGMSNLAAYFGVDNTRAAGAMYQMSQALAAGKVQLMDWRSLINAGMSGEAFQKALIRTSEVMGTGAEAMIEKYGSFNESLTQGGWLTSDVMLETLKQISGAYKESELRAQGYTATEAKAIATMAERANQAATEVRTVTGMLDAMKESVQSGWAISWEHILGDKEEATKLLTSVKNAFEAILEPSTTARNKMLEFWNEAGGRDDVIKGLSNIFGGLGKGLGSIGQAFRDVFPAMTGKRLVELSEGFKNLSEKFKMSDSTAKKIKSTFKGLFSVVKIGVDAVKGLFKGLSPMVDVLLGVGRGFVTVTGFIGDFVSKIAGAVSKTNILTKIGEGISTAFGSVGKVLGGIGDSVGTFISGLSFDGVGNAFATMGKGLAVLGEGFNGLLKGIGDAIGTIDFGVIMKGINALLGVGILNGIRGLVKSFKEVGESFNIFEKIGEIGDNVSEILDTVRDSLAAYQNSLNASTLLKIAAAVGILAASLLLLASIKPENMESGLVGLTVIFAELVAAMAILLKLSDGAKLKGIFTLTTTMIAISSAILILSAALKNISGLDWGQLGVGLVGLAGMLAMLVGTLKLLDKKDKILIKTSVSLVIFAAAIRSLSKAVESMGKMNPEALLKGLIGVGVVLAELVAFMKLTDVNKMGMKNAAGLLILAGAVNALSVAVGAFGKMNPASLLQGLVGVAAILTELGVFMTLTGNASGMLKTSAAMVVMGAAMNILAGAIRSIAAVPWEGLAKSLIGMATSLTIFGFAASMIPAGKLILVSAGIATMSAALIVLSTALKSLGSQSWESVAISLVSLAGALTVLGVAMYAMSGCLLGAAALTAVSLALSLLVPQLVALGSLSLAQVGTGLLALAGAFTVVGVAGALLTPLIPAILGLSAALAVLGIACVAIGAGLLAFGTGLSLVAASGGAAIAILVNGIKQLVELLPQLGTNLGLMIVNLVQAFSQNLPTLVTAIGTLITGMLQAFTTAIPQIVQAGVTLIVELGNAILQALPRLLEIGIKIVLTILEGIATNATKLVSAGIDIIVNFINGISANIGKVVDAGINLVLSLINGIADGINKYSGKLADAMVKLVKALISAGVKAIGAGLGAFKGAASKLMDGGFIQGIKSKISAVVNAAKSVISSAKNAFQSGVAAIKTVATSIMNGFVSTMQSAIGKVTSVARTIINGLKSAFSAGISAVRSIGSNIINGFVSAIQSGIGRASSAARSIISGVRSALSSGIGAMRSIGSSMISGLIGGISSMASSVASKARSVVQGAINAAKSALKINSPSRVFIGIGKYTGEGFIKGLDSYAGKVKNSTSDLANTAIEAMTNPLSKVSALLNDDVDMNPTITPVLDLTNIQNGSRTIGSLLGSGNGLTLSADASGAISRTIGTIQNGNDNSDILHALKDLKDGLSNTGNTTYSINGITYDDGSNVSNAVETLVRAARIERRI